MKIVAANGIKLACECFGERNGTAILLISGLGAQMVRWAPRFCQELAGYGYRVIRFDNRDAGYSTHLDDIPPPDFGVLIADLVAGRRPAVPYALTDMAADTIALMDALSIDKAHLVGRSMGGMIAQIIASEYPSRVRSLTSIMSSSGNPALPQADQDVLSMMLRPTPDSSLDLEGYVDHVLAFSRRLSGPCQAFEEGAFKDMILEEVRRGVDSSGTSRQLAAMVTAGDRRRALATISAPTAVIHGSDDPLIPAACGRDTAASIAGAEFHLMQGMGHEIPSNCYRSIAAAIHQVAMRQ
jgi:pimeloyl-ACP methyl ester carboxylesterase